MSADYSALTIDFLGLMERRQIPFVVVGGIALLQYVHGHNTDDLDLIISAPHLADLPELSIRERTAMFAYGHFHDLRVDIRLAEHPVFDLVAREFTTTRDYQVGRLPTATVEGLLLLKLFALPSLYRQFDYDRIAIYEADITQLLSRSEWDDAIFMKRLAPHIPDSDRVELEAILREIRGRLRRMKRPD